MKPGCSHFFVVRIAALCAGIVFMFSQASPAQDTTSAADAEKAWKEVVKATNPPMPPQQWQTNRPSREEIEKFRTEQGVLAGNAADKAKAFYTTYPKHAKVEDAHKKELEMLKVAVQLGNTNKIARLEEVETERMKDPKLTEDERLEMRVASVRRAAMAKQGTGQDAVMAELEKGARALQKDFPKRDEPLELLLVVASNADGEKGLALAKEVSEKAGSDKLKARAEGILKKAGILGKPLQIKFTAVDGREVDISKMAGKVVLVDFWATWCGPCVAELPHVKAAYDKLNPKGFEIVGISFDSEKDALTKFVEKEKMKWPQFFDGEGWGNKFGKEYGINGIPEMWLVDKKGVLRDMNARGDLEAKVEKLLAE